MADMIQQHPLNNMHLNLDSNLNSLTIFIYDFFYLTIALLKTRGTLEPYMAFRETYEKQTTLGWRFYGDSQHIFITYIWMFNKADQCQNRFKKNIQSLLRLHLILFTYTFCIIFFIYMLLSSVFLILNTD